METSALAAGQKAGAPLPSVLSPLLVEELTHTTLDSLPKAESMHVPTPHPLPPITVLMAKGH